MPANFPEAWLARVEHNLRLDTEAPWLEGIEEIDAPVIEGAVGTAGEFNEIHLPLSEFEVDLLINNSTYPIEVQAYDDDTITIKLDKYQTKATSVSDDQINGASYNKIDTVTKKHDESIKAGKFGKAIHSLAPAGHTVNTPVWLTTGAVVGEANYGRKILRYEDIVAMKDAFDKLQVPMTGRRLVLSTDHWNDALLDRQRFGDQLVNYKTGMPAPNILGFQIYQNVANPYFTAQTKKAYGSTPVVDEDFQASVAFHVPSVAKKTGKTKQYFKRSETDPQNQSNLLNYRHYFICVPKRAKYIGAIASGSVVDPG